MKEGKIIVNKLYSWYEGFVENLPNIAVALVVLIASIYIARGVKKLFVKVLFRKWENEELKSIMGRIFQLTTLIIGFMTALSILDLSKTVTSILAGVGVLGLALGFAFQDIAANFISGLFMAARKPFEVGDIIEVADVHGQVKDINLRTTIIETFDGNDVIIPNRDVFQSPIKNYFSTPYQRILIEVGVGYNSDLEFVKKITLERINKIEGRIEDKEPQLFYRQFGASSINYEVRFWVPYGPKASYLQYESEAIMAIKELYNEHNINIPFPIRTIDLSQHKDLFGKGLEA